MKITDIDLLATYWTIAGDTFPGDGSELSPFPLRDRAEAAAKAGWRGMGFVYVDMVASIEQLGVKTVRNIFSNNGIKHVELEFLNDWHLDGAKRAAAEATFSEMLDVGAQLGAKKIKVGGGVLEEGKPDIARMREAFAGICEKAAKFDMDIVMEFLPFSLINTIDLGLAVVKDLGTTNGGLLVDIWHVARGGMSFDEIRKIPSNLLKAVELDDANAQPVGSLFEDSTDNRKMCGEGALNVPAFIQTVVDVGYTGYWGVELISAEVRKLPLEQAAQRAFDTAMKQFESIRFPTDKAA
jgi:sugar phosphate isomerase/epimerase